MFFLSKTFRSYQRSNYVLEPEQTLYRIYTTDIMKIFSRNIKKAEQAVVSVQKDFDVEKVIELASATNETICS